MPHLVVRSNGRDTQSEGEASFRTGAAGGAGAWWQWDGQALAAGSEPYGFYPLYLLRQPGCIGIATSIVELLPFMQDRTMDADALGVFLRLGYYLGQDTPWRSIRAFPAASRIHWVPGAAPVVTDAFVPGDVTSLSRGQVIRHYLELFEASITASVPRYPVVVPLSGGRDSRHILLELMRCGRRPDRTFTAWRADDIRIAGRLAEAVGVEHQVVTRRGSMHDELRKNVVTSFCSDEHGWIMPAVDALDGSPLSIYDGIGGGMLSAGAFLNAVDVADFEAGRFGDIARRLLLARQRKLQRAGRSMLARFPLEPAMARVEAELRAWSGRVNGLTEFHFWNRTRREISLYTFEMLGIRHEVHAPYMSRALIAFLLSLPAHRVLDGTLHTETIAVGYPLYAGVPYEQRTGARRLWRRVSAVRPQMALQAHSALKHLQGELLRSADVGRIALHASLEERVTVSLGAPICIAQAMQWPVERMQLVHAAARLSATGQSGEVVARSGLTA